MNGQDQEVLSFERKVRGTSTSANRFTGGVRLSRLFAIIFANARYSPAIDMRERLEPDQAAGSG